MTNSKHTPGPWTADNGDGEYYGVFDETGNPVAYLVEPRGPGYRMLPYDGVDKARDDYTLDHEHAANARLMAASPDLLAALRALITMAESEEIPNDEYEAVFDTVKAMARAAITKADGASLTDNTATLEGYTRELHGHAGILDLYLLVKPQEDIGERFRAYDMDLQEFIMVNGWLFSWVEVESCPTV